MVNDRLIDRCVAASCGNQCTARSFLPFPSLLPITLPPSLPPSLPPYPKLRAFVGAAGAGVGATGLDNGGGSPEAPAGPLRGGDTGPGRAA